MFRKSVLPNSAKQVMMRRCRQSMSASMSSTVKSTATTVGTTSTNTHLRDVRALSSLQHQHYHHDLEHDQLRSKNNRNSRNNMEEMETDETLKSLKSLMDTLQIAVHLHSGPRTLTTYDMETAAVAAVTTSFTVDSAAIDTTLVDSAVAVVDSTVAVVTTNNNSSSNIDSNISTALEGKEPKIDPDADTASFAETPIKSSEQDQMQQLPNKKNKKLSKKKLKQQQQSPQSKKQSHPPPRHRKISKIALQKQQSVEGKIQLLMNDNLAVQAMVTLRESPVDLTSTFLYHFFRFLLTRDPLYAYEVLHVYYIPQQEQDEKEEHEQQQQLKQEDRTKEMYALLAARIQDLVPSHGPTERTIRLIYQLLDELKESHEDIIPILLESTSASLFMPVKRLSRDIYEYLVNHTNYEFQTDYLERLLSHSRFWSTDHLPYDEVLQRLAETSSSSTTTTTQPCRNPHFAVNALSNMFPFLDTPKITTAVSALLQIAKQQQQQQQQQNDDDDITTTITTTTPPLDIDVGTLEQLLSSAARKGDYELGLLVWDLVDTLELSPTESMYESMMCAFVMGYRQDHAAFACLADMEQDMLQDDDNNNNGSSSSNSGDTMTPSRALIRGISRSLRFSVNRIDNAYRCVVQHKFGCRPTTTALNCIMSSCAEIGDVERTFSVLMDDFAAHKNAKPNVHSFSFAMESLAVSTQLTQQRSRAIRRGGPYASSTDTMMNHNSHEGVQQQRDDADDYHYNQQQHVEEDPMAFMEERKTRLDAAEVLLNMMEDMAIEIDGNVFHQYIRVLINCNELEQASMATVDALGAGRSVHNKTLILLFNHVRDIAVARILVSSTSEPLEFLQVRLQKWEEENDREGSQLDNSESSKVTE